jgi:hypothetical protein
MMLSLAMIVFPSAILLLFAQEFARLTRKLLAIPGVKLLLPILLASCLIEIYQDWEQWVLLYTQAKFHNWVQMTGERMPFQAGAQHLIRVASLFILPCLPISLFWVEVKRKGEHTLPAVSYYLSAMLWLVAASVLIVLPN